MKFHQLPLGARFEWRNAVYRKIAPLKAANEADDEQKLVPRSAEVRRLSDDPEQRKATPPLPQALASEVVETAVWAFVDACRAGADTLQPPLDAEQRTQLAAAIELAAQQLLIRLATNAATG